jgi:hypothetical protein
MLSRTNLVLASSAAGNVTSLRVSSTLLGLGLLSHHDSETNISADRILVTGLMDPRDKHDVRFDMSLIIK